MSQVRTDNNISLNRIMIVSERGKFVYTQLGSSTAIPPNILTTLDSFISELQKAPNQRFLRSFCLFILLLNLICYASIALLIITNSLWFVISLNLSTVCCIVYICFYCYYSKQYARHIKTAINLYSNEFQPYYSIQDDFTKMDKENEKWKPAIYLNPILPEEEDGVMVVRYEYTTQMVFVQQQQIPITNQDPDQIMYKEDSV